MSVLLPGDIIEGRFKVVKLLGEGGMNRVYLVQDVSSSARWALKVSREPGELDSSQQEVYNQFLKEVSILSTLKHKNLPVINDYFSDGTRHYVIEEFIEGSSLADLLKKAPSAEDEVVKWAIELCDVLELLHKNNIIFRDLKPENIMLSSSGELKLIDFDIARYYKPGRDADTLLLGTPGYAAPETYGKTQSDARSDVYSLGATLHHLLTRIDPQDHPFHFEPVHKFRRRVNRDLEKLVMKAVEQNAANRFGTVTEMRQSLSAVQKQLQPPAPALTGARKGAQSTPGLTFTHIFAIIALVVLIGLVKDCLGPIMQSSSTGPVVTPRPSLTATRPPSPTPAATASEPEYSDSMSVQEVPIVASGAQLKGLRTGSWDSPVGDSLILYPPTYLTYPGKMTEVDMTITPSVVVPGSVLKIMYRFIAHHHCQYGGQPWIHKLTLFAGMPKNDSYARSWTDFREIPGTIISYHIKTLNRVGGNSAAVELSVNRDDSIVEGTLKWKPDAHLPSLRYSVTERWNGPRIVLNMEEQWYSWQYTKGFVIGTGKKKTGSSSIGRSLRH